VPEERAAVPEIPPVQAEEPGPAPEIEYLPMHSLSELPSFSERAIRDALVYPPIALRSNIEGIVYLELFVDNHGEVRRVTILREEPAGRGFGEAAVKAFTGLKGKAARANGREVAARYRYPVRFIMR
ncbi:MAG: energy transducer TonB, partial [Treponema sp.]|nr:energy transducer TonB [Treponema sp.]